MCEADFIASLPFLSWLKRIPHVYLLIVSVYLARDEGESTCNLSWSKGRPPSIRFLHCDAALEAWVLCEMNSMSPCGRRKNCETNRRKRRRLSGRSRQQKSNFLLYFLLYIFIFEEFAEVVVAGRDSTKLWGLHAMQILQLSRRRTENWQSSIIQVRGDGSLHVLPGVSRSRSLNVFFFPISISYMKAGTF